MTKKDQRRIMRELLTNMRTRMSERVDKFPTSFDGHEIRALLMVCAREFESPMCSPARSVGIISEKQRRARWREFQNYAATQGY